MGILAKSEEPDKMPHHAAFHLGLHCLLGQKLSLERCNIFLKIIISDPSIITMNHPDFIVCSLMDYSIRLKRFNKYMYLQRSDIVRRHLHQP